MQRERGRGREEGKAWAYGKGWPWTTSSIARAYHVLPMYDLQAANKRREGCKGEEEREGRRGRQGWPSYYPYGYSMMYVSEEEEKGKGDKG